MFKTMITFLYISTGLAMISAAIVCVNYLLKRDKYAIDYSIADDHIKICRKASLLFTFLAWMTASFEKKEYCLKGYLELSKACSQIGVYWLICAFICVAVCISMVSLKKERPLIVGISKFRDEGFTMGAVFLIISFLLNVG